MKKLLIFVLLLIGLPVFSLEEYTTGYFQNLTDEEAVELIYEQNKHIDKFTTKEFEIFYTNLKNFLQYRYIEIKASAPFHSEIMDETDAYLAIDYEYLYKHSQNLSKEWKQFLYLKTIPYKKQKEKCSFSVAYNVITMPQKDLPNLLKREYKYILNNPSFSQIDEMKKDYQTHFEHLISNGYTFNNWNNDIDKDSIKMWKIFLRTFPKNTKEYTTIQNWYNVIQRNNYQKTDEVLDYLHAIDKTIFY